MPLYYYSEFFEMLIGILKNQNLNVKPAVGLNYLKTKLQVVLRNFPFSTSYYTNFNHLFQTCYKVLLTTQQINTGLFVYDEIK